MTGLTGGRAKKIDDKTGKEDNKKRMGKMQSQEEEDYDGDRHDSTIVLPAEMSFHTLLLFLPIMFIACT